MTETANTPDLPTQSALQLRILHKQVCHENGDHPEEISTPYSDGADAITAWNTRPQPDTGSAVTVKPLDLHDAVTHRHSWTAILESAIENAEHEDDKSYIEHEKRALLNLLDILSAIQPAPTTPPAQAPTVAEAAKVPEELLELTFAIQHNPNCPSPWLVRLCGKSCIMDMKPYSSLTPSSERTVDILGFGKTIEEAARCAISEQTTSATTTHG